MWRAILVATLFVTNVSIPVRAIVCNLCDENSCNNQCTGDFCKISSSTVAHNQSAISQGCYTGDLPGPGKPACYRTVNEVGDEMVECYCNNGSACNNISLTQSSKVSDFGPITCELIHGGENANKSCEGAYCFLSYSILEDGSKIVYKGCVNTAFPPLMPMELKPDPPPACISVTSSNEEQGGFTTEQQCLCASAMCNKDETSLKQPTSSSPNKQVTCFQQLCLTPDNCVDDGTCQGDYCYESKQSSAFNETNGMKTIGCLNTSQPIIGKTERQIEQGYVSDNIIRVYMKQHIRVCAENYCITKASKAKHHVRPTAKPTTNGNQQKNTGEPVSQTKSMAQNQKNADEDQSKKNAATILQHRLFTLQITLATMLTFLLYFQ